ncbi:hypothetical protein JOB18_034000 [Solea senegalensis]|uniref:Uncharacterized protein n=1 Tax=Solea senegalensis TaxID=28829 RepID=A0AAV6QNK7_SOLSE|nr:hypothetical protein JOB18_034000 [Solea senegalensis]
MNMAQQDRSLDGGTNDSANSTDDFAFSDDRENLLRYVRTLFLSEQDSVCLTDEQRGRSFVSNLMYGTYFGVTQLYSIMVDKGDGVHVGRNQPPLLILPHGDRPTATQLTNSDIAVLNRLWNLGMDPFTYNRQMLIMQQDNDIDGTSDADSSIDGDDSDFANNRNNLFKALCQSSVPFLLFLLLAWSAAVIILDFFCRIVDAHDSEQDASDSDVELPCGSIFSSLTRQSF